MLAMLSESSLSSVSKIPVKRFDLVSVHEYNTKVVFYTFKGRFFAKWLYHVHVEIKMGDISCFRWICIYILFFETSGGKKYRKFASRLIRMRFYFIIKIVAALKIKGLDTFI